jgi:hypothetical protein
MIHVSASFPDTCIGHAAPYLDHLLARSTSVSPARLPAVKYGHTRAMDVAPGSGTEQKHGQDQEMNAGFCRSLLAISGYEEFPRKNLLERLETHVRTDIPASIFCKKPCLPLLFQEA